MNKAVLISIRPEWCDLIISGEKTIEVRKTRPRLRTPFTVYIYETKAKTKLPWADEDGHLIYEGKGKIIAKFLCDEILDCDADSAGLFEKNTKERLPGCCMSYRELIQYSMGELPLYGWHISDLRIYERQRDITDFSAGNGACVRYLRRPPRSWCYVKEAMI